MGELSAWLAAEIERTARELEQPTRGVWILRRFRIDRQGYQTALYAVRSELERLT